MYPIRWQQSRLPVLAQPRKERQHLSQQWDEVEAPEEEFSAVAIEAAVEAGAKANRKPVRVCQKDHALNTSVMEERHTIV